MISSLFKFAIMSAIAIALLVAAYEVKKHHGINHVSWAIVQEDVGHFVAMAQADPRSSIVLLGLGAFVLRRALMGSIARAGLFRLALMVASAMGACVGWAWWSSVGKIDPTLNWVESLDYSAAYAGLWFGAPLLTHSCAGWLAANASWSAVAKAVAALAAFFSWAKFGGWLAGPTLAEVMSRQRLWGIGHWAGAIAAGAAAAAVGAALVSAIPSDAPSSVLSIPKELKKTWQGSDMAPSLPGLTVPSSMPSLPKLKDAL